MFFESKHSAISDFCIIQRPEVTTDFPLHLHQAMELYVVFEGKVEVTIEDKKYLLEKDRAVLVFPYQRHSYKIIEKTTHVDCLFSIDFAPEFYRDKDNLCPQDNSFDFDHTLIPNSDDYLAKKYFVYLALHQFEKSAKYEQSFISDKNDLLCKILLYVSQNFSSECTLKQVSEHVGYDYAYVSKFFKKETKRSLHSYVNDLRIEKAKNQLLYQNLPVYLIAEKCGFKCLRTFNREFRKQVGQTPLQFKKTQSAK